MPKHPADQRRSSVITSKVLTDPKAERGTTVITSPLLLSGAGGADAATARTPSRASAKRARGTTKKRGRTTPPADSSADLSSSET